MKEEKESLGWLHNLPGVPAYRWQRIKKGFPVLMFRSPKEVAPPFIDRLRYFLAQLRLLLPIPDRYMEKSVLKWGLRLKFVSSNRDEEIYERKGLLYLVPKDGRYHSELFGLIWEINLLNKCQEPPVIVEEGDTVIDCGANIGVATLLFAQRTGKRGKVIAIEPEAKNYEVLRKVAKLNEGKVAPILPLKVAVYREDCPLELNTSVSPSCHTLSQYYGERQSHLLNTKEEIQALKIDTLVEQLGLEKVDFIKMDIEGAEVDALLGAEETIKRFKPKLAISTYHRPTDPVEIREILLRYNPSYCFKELKRGEKVLYAWDKERTY